MDLGVHQGEGKTGDNSWLHGFVSTLGLCKISLSRNENKYRKKFLRLANWANFLLIHCCKPSICPTLWNKLENVGNSSWQLHCFNIPWWLRRLRICLQCGRPGFSPWVGKIPWIREWLPTPVFWPGESHGQRNLVGYSPRGYKELDRTEQLSLSTIQIVIALRIVRQYRKDSIHNMWEYKMIVYSSSWLYTKWIWKTPENILKLFLYLY